MAFRKLFFKRVQGIRDNYLLQEGDIALDEDDFLLYRGDGSTTGGIAIAGAGGGSGIALTDISVTQASASGAGTLAYNSSTGVFTYTPPTIPAAITDLSISDGTNGQVLTTNGSGGFTFEDASGGGGSSLQSRTTKAGTTGSLANAAQENLDITGFKGYALLQVQTDRAARVRIYTDAASRTADASRAEGTDPTADAGVIAEVITTGAQTVIISPGAFGFNNESTPTTTIPCRVTNKSGGTSTVVVTLHVLQLES
jgi:hypothetical protein